MECHTGFSADQYVVAVCKVDEVYSNSCVAASVLFAGDESCFLVALKTMLYHCLQ